MRAIEAGDKSKETIKIDFLAAYPESEGKSTFSVFFTDVIRPFGSASVSRDMVINTAPNGCIQFDHDRGTLIKIAVSRGLLTELSAIGSNSYPKRDHDAVAQLIKRFGISSSQQAALRENLLSE